MKILKWTVLSALTIGLASCQKEKEEQQEIESENTEEVALILSFDQEMDNMADMSMEGNPEQKSAFSTCLSYNIDTSGVTNIITLDWGSSNCQGPDGVYRRGIIKIMFDDQPFQPGSVRTITLDGYAVNDFEINGYKSITFMGMNSNQQPYANLQSDLTVMRPDSSEFIWNSSRQRTWVEGFMNFDPFDNVVEVTGEAEGTTASGIDFELDITKALRAEATCSNIVSGTIDISSPAFSTRSLDYGNGSCDNVATISVNGNSKTITLK